MVGLLRSAGLVHILQVTQEVRGALRLDMGFLREQFSFRCQPLSRAYEQRAANFQTCCGPGDMEEAPAERKREKLSSNPYSFLISSRMWSFLLSRSLISGASGTVSCGSCNDLEVLVKEVC